MNVRQTIPPGISVGSIKNIPDKWSAGWFRDFVSQYLQHSDTRNATAGTGISITGNLGTPATIASTAISGPPFSVFGNPTANTAANGGIQAMVPNTVLQFSGSLLSFGKIKLADASGLGPILTVSGLNAGSFLQATTDGSTAGFSTYTLPTSIASGDILVGSQTGVVGSLPIGAPGNLMTVSGTNNPQWVAALPWAQISGTPTTLAGYGLPNKVSTGWGAPSGAAVQNSFSGAAATLAQTSAAVAQLITDLIAAGVIGV